MFESIPLYQSVQNAGVHDTSKAHFDFSSNYQNEELFYKLIGQQILKVQEKIEAKLDAAEGLRNLAYEYLQ